MQISDGDLWSFVGKADAVCVTTNGVVKTGDVAVMGKGIAEQALTRYPGINATLGGYLIQHGNRPFVLKKDGPTSVCSFPTKPKGAFITAEEAPARVCTHMVGRFKYPCEVTGWALKSDLNLILESARHLSSMADKFAWKTIYLPVPGCGHGELSPDTVLASLTGILDNRFTILKRT